MKAAHTAISQASDNMGWNGSNPNETPPLQTFIATYALPTHVQWGGYHYADFLLSKAPSLIPSRGHAIEKI